MPSPSPKRPDDAPCLQQAQALADMLSEEREILLSGDSAALDALTERKQAALSALESAVGERETAPQGALREALLNLQRANQENGALLGVRQSYARWALNELRGSTPAPVYGGQGQCPHTTAARLIGRA